jgi:hypothetical protein
VPVRQQIGLVLFQQTEETVVNVFILRHVILQRQRLQEHGKDQVHGTCEGDAVIIRATAALALSTHAEAVSPSVMSIPNSGLRAYSIEPYCGANEAPSPSQLTPMQNAALRFTLSSVSARPAMAAGVEDRRPVVGDAILQLLR